MSALWVTVAVAPHGRLPVAPHVWLVLIAASFLASGAAVLAARSRLTVAAGVTAAGMAMAGAAVLVGSELVAVGLAVTAAIAGFAMVALAEPVRRRSPRLLAAVGVGVGFAAITAAAAVAATGGARMARSAPVATGQLAMPLYVGGALVVDGAALVVLVLLVASRSRAQADGAPGEEWRC